MCQLPVSPRRVTGAHRHGYRVATSRFEVTLDAYLARLPEQFNRSNAIKLACCLILQAVFSTLHIIESTTMLAV